MLGLLDFAWMGSLGLLMPSLSEFEGVLTFSMRNSGLII